VAEISFDQARELERCLAQGGIAVFPADTVYGLACDAADDDAVARLYALKGRDLGKPSAVLFFTRDAAHEALAPLGERTQTVLDELLPGPVTLLLPNPARLYPAACGSDPQTLGVRIPALSAPLAALALVRLPVLQSSANEAGGAEARRVDDVPEPIRDAADLVLDGGELPGRASTVVDLRDFERSGEWSVVREGALPADEIALRLG
jgi:L-threonylcarbamoyladenylate synthase